MKLNFHLNNIRNYIRGKYRSANSPSHSDPTVGAGGGSGGSTSFGAYFSVTGGWTIPASLTSVSIRTGTGRVAFVNQQGEWEFEPPPPPPKIPYAGIQTGELIGHRMWVVIRCGNELRLASLVAPKIWEPGETVSGDLNKWINLSGVYGGVYAFHDAVTMQGDLDEMLASIFDRGVGVPWNDNPITTHRDSTLTIAVGTVKMWGDVVEHEMGYRSQYAKINTIDNIYWYSRNDSNTKSVCCDLNDTYFPPPPA